MVAPRELPDVSFDRKGRTESVIDVCDAVEIDEQTVRSTRRPGRRPRIYNGMSADGLRVLAVAYRAVEVRVGYTRDDESHLFCPAF